MLDRQEFNNDLEYLVNIDSGYFVREGVNTVGEWFAEKFADMGWQIKWFDLAPTKNGRSFITFSRQDSAFDLLILCHLDTIFPADEAQRRPFSVDGTRLRGPGVADMKSGLLFTYLALKQLQQENRLSANIGVFFNGEHEIGCPNTRLLIEEFSLKSKAVITAEPARSNGAYVNRRKGVGRYKLSFLGKSAHSGVNPEDGIDAVNELAHWILSLRELSDLKKGVYVNSGIVKGGLSVNSVPGEAEISVETRFVDMESGIEIDKKIRSMMDHPFNEGIKVHIEGGIKRPPMIPSEKTGKLCEIIEAVGREFQVDVKWATSGGGSDASFAAALGIPAVCGLAAVGGNLHSELEYVETQDLESRFKVFKESIFRISTAL
ncbi:MAG: M20 family metallopeptidase [Candidatus Zhuqueibacterota bacterium]